MERLCAIEQDERTLLITKPEISTDVHIKKLYEKRLAVYFIVGSIFFERIAFYTLTNNIFNTLHRKETLNWTSQHSSSALHIFSGVRYIATLVFAALCDARLGRTKTIILGFILYLIGYILVIINSKIPGPICKLLPNDHNDLSSIGNEKCASVILLTLICAAVGAGTVQANMAIFAAEQIQDSKSISRYADIYMIVINTAYIFSFIATGYITEHPEYYYLGYTVATVILIFSILLFIIGRRYAKHVKPYDTIITKFFPIIINAFQSWYNYRRNKQLIHSEISTVDRLNEVERDEQSSISFLDFAKVINNGKFQDRFVNDVKSLLRMIIVTILIIPYSLLYNQINTTFDDQANKMHTPYNPVPIDWMSLVEPLTIIIGIVILSIFVYKYFDGWNKQLILTSKLVIGMCLAILGMCASGTVEIFRQKNCTDQGNSSLPIYAQLPQNIFIGTSEVFAVVASYEYAYYASPRSAQSLFMGFHFSASGVAQFIDMGIYESFLKPAKNYTNFNCLDYENLWKYDSYFFILAGLQVFFIIIFIVCHKKFRIIQLNPEQVKPTQSVVSNNRD